jgi:hypothetical protein
MPLKVREMEERDDIRISDGGALTIPTSWILG